MQTMQHESGVAKMAVEMASFFSGPTPPPAAPAPLSSSSSSPPPPPPPSIYSLVQLRQEKASICCRNAPAQWPRPPPTPPPLVASPDPTPSFPSYSCSTVYATRERESAAGIREDDDDDDDDGEMLGLLHGRHVDSGPARAPIRLSV